MGPSAPPMMPIEAASPSEKSPMLSSVTPRAPQNAMKIPTCAAAPSSSVLGLAISGLKSVSAPMPMKMIGGRMFHEYSP